MKFSIQSIILWPKNPEFIYRKIDFSINELNIITGASRTGKSAIIPIVDYCLGSGECTIPVGVIRDTCSWFGILIQSETEQLLICRKEPGSAKSTGAMFLTRGSKVAIPERIDKKNITQDQLKNTLNELFGMTFLEIDPVNSGNFSSRPSYRDLMSFIFQPQNIIANNRTLFYNIEKLEHKNRLVNIFPYILGAVNAKVLCALQEKERLVKEQKKLLRELRNIKDVSERWKQEVATWISTAQELGLTDWTGNQSAEFIVQINELRRILQTNEDGVKLSSEGLSNITQEVIALQNHERELSRQLSAAKNRYEAMMRLEDAKSDYESSLQIQKDRLDISSWLRSLANNPESTIFKHDADDILDKLCSAIAEIERQTNIVNATTPSYDRELVLVKGEIDKLIDELNEIRKRIVIERSKQTQANEMKYTIEGISRFLGKLEFAVQTYESLGTDSELESKLADIEERIAEQNTIISGSNRASNEKIALSYIDKEANSVVKDLDVEYPDDPIEFDKQNLTIKVLGNNGRENYLWEMGSASNWLSYHLSIILAFQKFFQERAELQIPNFIILDQPSQVYFPQRTIQDGSSAEEDSNLLKDEDKDAVKKIFTALSKYISNAKSEIQIIVMEHADEDIWGEIGNIHLAARWRDGEKLIPKEWIVNNNA